MLFLLAAAMLFACGQPAQAQTYSVMYTFCSEANCADGSSPNANLILDGQGNVYGTTSGGGSDACELQYGCGVVFQLSPSGTESLLYSFGALANGYIPDGGVLRDASGNLYGTTAWGGYLLKHQYCPNKGCGVIFQLTPAGAENILYIFDDAKGDYTGMHPFGSMVVDSLGNFYGTTGGYGAHNTGTVFKLTPGGSESVLHWFGSVKHDGRFPYADLVVDGRGNIYGTTQQGGSGGSPAGGTVYEINAAGVETILHSFGGRKHLADGTAPNSLVMDAAGNLYGTTIYTIFKLTPSGVLTTIYDFQGTPDGAGASNLIIDAQGNLYGTTSGGGTYGYGTVFKFMPAAGQETVLYSFTGGANGEYPYGNLAVDGKGNFYGLANGGNSDGSCSGYYGCDVVFKLTP